LHRICFLRTAERHAELRASLAGLRGAWMQLPYGAMLAEPRVASVLARIGADDEVRAILSGMPDTVFAEQINSISLAEAVWATGDPSQAARLLPRMEIFADRWPIY